MSDELRAKKLEALCDIYAMGLDALLEHYGFRYVVPGICMNPTCDYTTTYEPDSNDGWCELCDTGTVVSFLVLSDMI